MQITAETVHSISATEWNDDTDGCDRFKFLYKKCMTY